MVMATQAIDAALSALADPARRKVIDLLRARPRRAGELARALRVSAPLMSRHLRILRQGGVVESAFVERDARGRIYRLREEPFAALRRWLERLDVHWGAQLDAFAKHVERAQEKRR